MPPASPAVSSADRHTELAGRQIPWSNEAEQAVLGAMLLDQDAALKAAEVLDDAMFYREGHRLLFRAMLALTERGDVIDPVTLRDELMRRGDLDRAGGMEYLGGLRSEEHTSELQSQSNLVCRLLLEKKNINHYSRRT